MEAVVHSSPRPVHRIGRLPEPWAWTPWQYAPFTGRWDDPEELYRVIYTAASRYACLLEVLAPFRPDPKLVALHQELGSDPADGSFPTPPAGMIPADWLSLRAAGTATLTGDHLAIGADRTLAWLQARASALLSKHGVAEFDGGVIRQSDRSFTQDLSRWLHEQTAPMLDGIEFESRHGDRLVLWATFERSGDEGSSNRLLDRTHEPLRPDDPELLRALARHGLAIESA